MQACVLKSVYTSVLFSVVNNGCHVCAAPGQMDAYLKGLSPRKSGWGSQFNSNHFLCRVKSRRLPVVRMRWAGPPPRVPAAVPQEVSPAWNSSWQEQRVTKIQQLL